MYLPVTAGGYFVYGEEVDSNISLSLTKTWLVTVANILMAIHLVLAFLIVINPVCQELEEILNVPHCEFDSTDKFCTIIAVVFRLPLEEMSFANNNGTDNGFHRGNNPAFWLHSFTGGRLYNYAGDVRFAAVFLHEAV